jgi:hypothetical protein
MATGSSSEKMVLSCVVESLIKELKGVSGKLLIELEI